MLFIGSYYHVWMSLSFDVMQRFYQEYAMVVGGILATTETVDGSNCPLSLLDDKYSVQG